MPSIQFSGLSSGLDTKAIVEAILDFESVPLTRLQDRLSLFNQRKNAFDELRSGLGKFETALRELTSPATFRGRSTTVSDEKVLRATAGSGAEVGIFQVEVSALAAADKYKSDGFVGSDQGLISDGTLTIQSGSEDAITINVSAANGNNSLETIRDAINDADSGVQAAIIFDGTNHRLTVRSEESGTTNALTITDDTNLNLDVGANKVTTAADAAFKIDGIDITSSSNKITTAIEGVTIDLISLTSGSPISIEVSQDEDSVVEATQSLVTKYNELTEFFNAQFDSEKPGPLSGDFIATAIQRNVQSLFTGGVDGIPFGGIRSLSAIGVSFDGKGGTATLDSGKLRELLDTNFDEVGNLFLSAGQSTDSRVSFVSASNSTVSGDYAVTISQAAEQATVTGSTALTTLGQDETLTIVSSSATSVVNLTSGQDITAVIDAINQQLRDDGVSATAISDSGSVRIASTGYGVAADISVTSSITDPANGTGSGFDTVAATDNGVDVVGTINGVAAEGIGQLLIGAEDDDSSGLRLKVTASAIDITNQSGDFGTLSFSRGFIDSLLSRIDSYTEFDSGALDVAKEGIDANVRNIDRDIERLQERLELRETQLLRSFSAAEQAISALNAQQSTLSSF